MNPHDGPVSAYQAARVELENAEVDYNYCLYYPLNEEFKPPPTSRARQPGKKATATQEARSRIWNLTKKCMLEGTLQGLKYGEMSSPSAGKRGDGQASVTINDNQTKSPSYGTFLGGAEPVHIQSFGQSTPVSAYPNTYGY